MVLKVLLVDDDEALTKLAKVFLERAKDIEVDTSPSAKGVLEKLKSESYDVIVSDYQMPGKDGIQLLEEIRAAGKKVPFILFTGQGKEEVVIEALNAGADHYLQKGGDPKAKFAELQNIIMKLFLRHRKELDLIESVERFKNIFDSANDSIHTLDLEGRFLEVNDVSCSLLGYTKQEMLQMNVRDIDTEDHAKNFPDHMNEVVENGFALFETEWKTKSGKRIPVEVNSRSASYAGRPAFLAVARDITVRKRLDAALRETESNYRQLADGITDMFLALDRNLRCTYWNKTCEGMTGISARDAIGKPLTELTPGPQAIRAEEAYLEVFRTGKARTFFSEVFIGGKNHVFESTAYPYENGLSVITKDITERKRVEEALLKSEAKFAVAFNSSPEMMVIGSMKEGRLIDVNSSFLRGTGHTREEVIGRTITEIGMVTEAGRDRVRSIMEEKGSVQGLEIHDRTKSGAERITLISAAVISIESEPCILVIISDITDRRRAEEAAREMEIRFQSFMNHLPAVCYMLDTSDRYIYVNKVFEEVVGIPANDLVGKSVRELWPPTAAEAFAKTHQEVFSSQKPLELVEEVLVKDDLREFLSLKFPVPALAGRSKILGGVSLDVTEQRRVEKALRRANKKLELLGSVTRHDAINQLSVLMAWLDIAMEVGRDLPTVEQLTKAQESARMLQGQLEFTAEYQEMGLKEPQWTDLETAAYSGVESLDLGSVSLMVDVKGVEVYADPMLATVFHNLVDNALRYGKKITQLRLHFEESGEGFVVVCEDDGVGISAGDKEKIFMRGFGEHTGLGLYLVREILELTGIKIRETGESGKGARFELLIPVGHYRTGRAGR